MLYYTFSNTTIHHIHFVFPAGVYMFGLFTTDIFVNAGQVVTGNLAPHFLTLCKPNYTALGCQQALRYISHQEACTGNVEDILRARKTFPSKEAALSVYAALYLAVSSSLISTNGSFFFSFSSDLKVSRASQTKEFVLIIVS